MKQALTLGFSPVLLKVVSLLSDADVLGGTAWKLGASGMLAANLEPGTTVSLHEDR